MRVRGWSIFCENISWFFLLDKFLYQLVNGCKCKCQQGRKVCHPNRLIPANHLNIYYSRILFSTSHILLKLTILHYIHMTHFNIPRIWTLKYKVHRHSHETYIPMNILQHTHTYPLQCRTSANRCYSCLRWNRCALSWLFLRVESWHDEAQNEMLYIIGKYHRNPPNRLPNHLGNVPRGRFHTNELTFTIQKYQHLPSQQGVCLTHTFLPLGKPATTVTVSHGQNPQHSTGTLLPTTEFNLLRRPPVSGVEARPQQGPVCIQSV